MFLKRVELIGFKSFAAKTAVDFLPGVTVIVGPNGCGKSNIFDAIRWVLGEQSAKSLRGTRMGDVIFAGSSSYKALSYAQVTLVISNDDRRVPVDFTEITVTRRLFNNGESEYLLNRVPCRLRDIMELFMDTGVGMDAYSFMGQGRVDQIISAKPIERRGIFEEAAGISKYKSRKDEALRKLIRTEEDLVRLADIIEEVRKNAASLKRQAAKAERYRELMSRQRDIEKNLLVLRGKNLIESSSGLEKELAGVETRHVELSARLARLNSKNEEERTQSDSISRDLAQDQDLAFAIKSDINRHQGNIKLLQERSANADETTANLKRDLEQDKGRASQLDQSIKEMEHESRDALATLRQVEKQYTDKKAAFETLKNTRLSRLHLLEEKRVVRADSLSKKSRLVNETRYAESMHERVLAQIREQETTLSDNRKSLAEITGLLEERRSSLKSCDSDISLRQEQKQKDLESFREFESRLNQARTDQEALVRRLREAESRLQVMRELKENFEGFQSGVKTVLKASGGGQIPGLGQPVATRINPPEKYEQAIEAALGAALQAILADSADHVEPALALLRDKKAGQASFLALDLCRFEDTNGRLKTLLASKGVLGLARNLVDVDEDHRSVVNALLGDTVIVDALPTAIRLFREGRRERFVTLQGECLDSRGMISGGSAQKTGILSRERDVRKLQELTVTLQKEYTRTEENLGELRRKREERRNALAALDQAIHALQVDRASLAKEVESVQKRRQELADILTAHEKRISQQRSELEKFQETIRKNGEVTARLDEVINALEKEIDTLLAEIDSQKDQETTLDGDVSSLLVEQTTRRERVQALQQRLDAAKGQAQAVQAAIASRLGEIESIAGRKKETAAAIHDTERELQGLIRKRDEIEKRISLRTQEKETLAVEIKKLGGELMIVQREHNETGNSLHELQVRQAQVNAQMESLSQQAEEKFQVSLSDLIARTGPVEGDRDSLINELGSIREQVDRIGPINAAAIDQYQEAVERFEFLTTQQKDLDDARESLKKTIIHIDRTTQQLFDEAFEIIRNNFTEIFRTLFSGGRADLILTTDENNPGLEPGIDIVAQPPGKKLQNIQLLSGGEKSLTAIALLFSIFRFKPSPFCLLDEIDAALDDVNVERFKDMLGDFSEDTQFIIVTHNKQTMTLADSLYGVTMEEPGVSKLVSVKFENLEESRLIS